MWANGPMHVDGCVPCRCAVQVIGVSVAGYLSSFVFFSFDLGHTLGSLLHLTVRDRWERLDYSGIRLVKLPSTCV